MKVIEMVCTGNQGRSPVAELLANNYLGQIGASTEYHAISSGTAVDSIRKKELPAAFMRSTISMGLERGIYTPSDISIIETNADLSILLPYFNKAVQLFGSEEHERRAKYLKEFGIEGVVKVGRDQTVARPDTVLVLSMDKRNNTLVEKIYAESEHQPLIDVLSRYATGTPEAEITNAFGRSEQAYKQAIEQLIEQVPLAVEKLLNSSHR